METVNKTYLRLWRSFALAISLALIAYLLYFRKLSSLLPGYSPPELATFVGAKNWHTIVGDPAYAPYKAIVWLFTAEFHNGIIVTRIVSAWLALIVGLLFYVCVRNWRGFRTAFLATVIFITSGALLHFARLGTGYITQMGILVLIDLTLWYRNKPNRRTWLGFCIVAAAALLLYIPGMIWFELLGAACLSATIKGQLRRKKTQTLAGLIVLPLLLIAPLVYECIKHSKNLLQILGLPQQLHQLQHFGVNACQTVIGIAARSYGSPLISVGHAPLLSAVEVVLGLLGAYYVLRMAKRRVFLFGYLALGLVLVSLGGDVTIACLVPILYLCVAIGMDHLLNEWMTVFPRNPIARMTGVGIVSLMLIFSVLYQVRAYYVAWPHAPATQKLFSHTVR